MKELVLDLGPSVEQIKPCVVHGVNNCDQIDIRDRTPCLKV